MNCLPTSFRCLPPDAQAAVMDVARARAVRLHDRAVQDAITRMLQVIRDAVWRPARPARGRTLARALEV